MSNPYKPTGYNAVSPYFVVKGAQQLIDLLGEIFAVKILRRYDLPDGTIMHAELQLDDSVLMLGEASEQFPANQHLVHVYVPDVDETYHKALRAGCEAVEPPHQRQGDPDRRGTFKDFAGNFWSIGTQVSTSP
ncbi:VOC family protein [soil metagenome]